MDEDARIIHEYRDVFRKYAKDGIIDLDDRLRHKFDFQVHRMEDYVRGVQGIIPPNRQSQSFIVLVHKGSGEKTIGHFSFPIHKNMLFIIPQRVVHSSKYWSLDCSGYIVSFNIGFFLQNAFPKHLIVDKKIFKHSIKPYLDLSAEQVARLDTIFKELLEEYAEQKRTKDEMLAVKVLELILHCDRFFTEAENIRHENVYSKLVEDFNELINKYYASERSVGFYAKHLHVHPNHLNALVKKYSGLTAKETIDDCIIAEARFLLQSSTHSVKEIAFELGFNTPAQFTSFFKRRMNYSPSQYKDHPV
jgi:AraC family transcriptional activator of pobA